MSRLRDADIRARNESAWLLPTGDERTNHRLRRDMRRYDENDEVDVVVVGCGAGGATFIQRMARAGASIVGLDAGPFWDPDADWVSDEWGSHRLYWTEPRVISGANPVPLGSNNSGRGVGGSMIHYAGYTPRFHPSDFETASPRRGRRRLAHQLRGPQAVLRGHRTRAPGLRPALALGRSAPLPLFAPATGGKRGGLRPRCPRARHRDPHRSGGHRQRALRPPAPLHLPGVLPPGLQGQRQGIPLDHPHPRRLGARGRDSGPRHGVPGRRRRGGSGQRGHLLHPWRRALPAGPHGGGGRVLHRDTPPAAACPPPRGSPTGSATTTARSVAT